MSWIKRLAQLIVALFMVVPSLLFAVLGTSTGSHWLLQRLISWQQLPLSYQRLSGDLLGDIALHGVRLSTADQSLEVSHLSLRWQPAALLERQLIIDHIVAEQVTMHLPSSHSGTEQVVTPPTIPTQLSLPLELRIADLQVASLRLMSAGEPIAEFSSHGRLVWQATTLQLQDWSLESALGTVQMNVTSELRGDYPTQLNAELGLTSVARGLTDAGARLQLVMEISTEHASGTLLLREIDGIQALAPANQLQFSLDEPLGERLWQGQLKLSALPVMPILKQLQSMPAMSSGALQDWLAVLPDSLRLDANIELSPRTLKLHQVQLMGDETAPLAQLTGIIDDYQDWQHTQSRTQASFDWQVRQLTLPWRWQAQPMVLIEHRGNWQGNLDLYALSSTSLLSFADQQWLNIGNSGIGNREFISFSDFTLEHPSFAARLYTQLGFGEQLWAAANIDAFHGDLQFNGNHYAVDLQGGFGFIDGAVSANQLRIRLNDTEVALQGALGQHNQLHYQLQLGSLQRWIEGDLSAASLRSAGMMEGDYTEQLRWHIDQLVVESEIFGDWQLVEQVTSVIDISQAQWALSDLCLNQQHDTNSICISSELQPAQLDLRLSAAGLPLSWLNRLREADVAEHLLGSVAVDSQWSFRGDSYQLHTLSGTMSSDNTTVTSLEAGLSSRFERWQLSWDGTSEALQGTFTAALEQQLGQILGDITVRDLLHEPQLQGSMDIAMSDLTLLQWILPDLRYYGASAVASIAMSGTVAKPHLSGSVELIADEIGFAESGLLLTDVKLSAADAQDNPGRLTLNGQAKSGAGWIALDGWLDLDQQQLALDVDGYQFRAVELNMATVDVSPDLHIQVLDQRVDITGSVTIPYARINEPELAATQAVSADVRLLENGKPISTDEQGLYPIYADVRLLLGDDVTVDAYGFSGKVTGNLRVLEAPNRASTATGSIQVAEGDYLIYGQQLNIQRGVLIYNGGTLDNPGLDLRVVRNAATMTASVNEQISVGAQVGGTLKAPDLRLFSSPAMPDVDILSYLVLGRPPGLGGSNNLQLQALLFLGSQGTNIIGERLQDTFGFDEFGIDSTADPLDTSFYIGKYLSPKLYVKYGVGLFENTNTFFLRYLLTDKLIIESTTSTEAQGGDIFYTIEK